MANKKISELPTATTIGAGDLLPVVHGGVTMQATPDLLPLGAAQAAAVAAGYLAKTATQPQTVDSPLTVTGYRFTASSATASRSPFNVSMTMDGSQFGANGDNGLTEKVGLNNTILFKGGFTGEQAAGALSPGFLFGANDYIITGQAAGDLDGVTDFYGRLIEAHIQAPGAAINVLRGLQVEAHLEPAATGGVVHNLQTLYIIAPRNGGTIDQATSLYIESPTTGTTNYGIFVAGGAESYFTGDIKLENKTVDALDGTVRAGSIIGGPVGSPASGAVTAVATGPAAPSIVAVGAAGQSANLQEWRDSGAVVKASVGANGQAAFATINVGAGALNNSGGTGLQIFESNPGNRVLSIQQADSPTADMTAWRNSSGGAWTRIDKSGRFTSIVSSAPALGDLNDGEFALYVDGSTGNLKVTSRVSGVLKTGTVTVA